MKGQRRTKKGTPKSVAMTARGRACVVDTCSKSSIPGCAGRQTSADGEPVYLRSLVRPGYVDASVRFSRRYRSASASSLDTCICETPRRSPISA
jgi:hypothetical protein